MGAHEGEDAVGDRVEHRMRLRAPLVFGIW